MNIEIKETATGNWASCLHPQVHVPHRTLEELGELQLQILLLDGDMP